MVKQTNTERSLRAGSKIIEILERNNQKPEAKA